MNYFSANFNYGKCDGHDEDEEQSLLNAESIIHDIFKNNGIKMCHEYSWPDGSLYKFIRSGNLTAEELRRKINFLLEDYEISVDVTQIPKETNPHKSGYSTLEEYFNNCNDC